MPEKRIVAMDASVPAKHTTEKRRPRVRTCTLISGGRKLVIMTSLARNASVQFLSPQQGLVWAQPPRPSSQAKRGARRRCCRSYGAVSLPGRTLFSRRGSSWAADFRQILERFLHTPPTFL